MEETLPSSPDYLALPPPPPRQTSHFAMPPPPPIRKSQLAMPPPPKRTSRPLMPPPPPPKRTFRPLMPPPPPPPPPIRTSRPPMPPPPPIRKSQHPKSSRKSFSRREFCSGNKRMRIQSNSPEKVGVSKSSRTSYSTEVFPTSAVDFFESSHGRERRQQRQIGIRDLQAAIKYGTREPAGCCRKTGNPRSKFTHNEITYIVDDVTKQEVTAYATECKIYPKIISQSDRERHQAALERIQKDKNCWDSHTIILVDKSGSMRNSDVRGSRTRLGAVWLSIAQDFIEQRLRIFEAGDQDVVSIILMGETAQLLIKEWPTDYVLYNKMVELFNNPNKIRPSGHGFYGPSITLCEKMLSVNDLSSCALKLLILSDGRPSDQNLLMTNEESVRNYLIRKIEGIASKFGRRLTIDTIGIGSASEFLTLQNISQSANSYGSIGQFHLPSGSCSSLGAAVSSVATSLTATQTELGFDGMSDQKRQRKVKPVLRENNKLIPLFTEVIEPKDFLVYMGQDVAHVEYDYETSTFKQATLQNPKSKGVAFKKMAFGEGEERLAHQFFEIEGDGVSVSGEPLVAKQSRFICTDAKWEDHDKFARQFCKIQHTARKYAIKFNEKLDCIRKLDRETPRISFLDCSIYYLTETNGEDRAVVVERRLHERFQKWNNNNGWKRSAGHLDIICENEILNISESDVSDSEENTYFFSKDEIAQAFSHFSYENSGKKLLICDLQGVYDGANKIFRFTDPVIHYHNTKKSTKKGVYGRTDRGQKGMHNFFKTHTCSLLCELVTKGFRSPHERCKIVENLVVENE